MKKLYCTLLILSAFATTPTSVLAQSAQALRGYCTTGGVKVVTDGRNSTNVVQASYPFCSVAVYLTGTTTPATIYSTSNNLPLVNPFIAKMDGSWQFYAPVGAGYDVVLSGGIPLPFPHSVTLTNVFSEGLFGSVFGRTGNIIAQTGDYTAAQVTNAVSTLPPATQTITQPSGTNFNIQTSGGGALLVNGSPIVNPTNAVSTSPGVSQTITQPMGTNLNVVGTLENNGNAFILSKLQAATHFGDSITVGHEALNPQQDGWVAWLDKFVGIPLNRTNNDGVGGSLSQNQDTVIFNAPQAYQPSQLITYMIGTNNVNAANSTDPNQIANYQYNVEGQIVFSLLPPTSRINFNSGPVTFGGTWSNDALIGKSCTGTTCSATFSGAGSVLYVDTYATNGNVATATLSCDGTPTGATLYFAGVGGETIAVPAGDSTMLTRVTGLSNTTHTCTIQSTSSTGAVQVEYAGFAGSTNTASPVYLFGQIIDENPVVSTTALYRTAQATIASQLQADGFTRLVYVPTTGVIPSTNYRDSLHPSNYGYYLLSQPFVTAVNTLLGTNYSNAVPGLVSDWAAPVGDFSKGGNGSMGIGFGDLNVATGAYDTALGYQSSVNMSTGQSNTTAGYASGQSLTTGSFNACFGFNSCLSGSTIQYDTAIGFEALSSDTAGNQTAVGANSLGGNTTGAQNTCVGTNCLFLNTTGSNNTAIGYKVGHSFDNVTTDSQITLVGSLADKDTNSIIIDAGAFGYEALVSASGAYEIGTGNCTTANTLCFAGNPVSNSTGALLPSAIQTSVNCSTSGTATFSMPFQGVFDKKVLMHLSACVGTASYTFPVAFTNAPSIYASNNVAASIATSVSKTAVTVTGATTTGSLVLEDY